MKRWTFIFIIIAVVTFGAYAYADESTNIPPVPLKVFVARVVDALAQTEDFSEFVDYVGILVHINGKEVRDAVLAKRNNFKIKGYEDMMLLNKLESTKSNYNLDQLLSHQFYGFRVKKLFSRSEHPTTPIAREESIAKVIIRRENDPFGFEGAPETEIESRPERLTSSGLLKFTFHYVVEISDDTEVRNKYSSAFDEGKLLGEADDGIFFLSGVPLVEKIPGIRDNMIQSIYDAAVEKITALGGKKLAEDRQKNYEFDGDWIYWQFKIEHRYLVSDVEEHHLVDLNAELDRLEYGDEYPDTYEEWLHIDVTFEKKGDVKKYDEQLSSDQQKRLERVKNVSTWEERWFALEAIENDPLTIEHQMALKDIIQNDKEVREVKMKAFLILAKSEGAFNLSVEVFPNFKNAIDMLGENMTVEEFEVIIASSQGLLSPFFLKWLWSVNNTDDIKVLSLKRYIEAHSPLSQDDVDIVMAGIELKYSGNYRDSEKSTQFTQSICDIAIPALKAYVNAGNYRTLVTLKGSEKVAIRLFFARLFWTFGSGQDRPLILSMMRDGDSTVRDAAKTALGEVQKSPEQRAYPSDDFKKLRFRESSK